MRRFTDDERWAAAASIARGQESPVARTLRRRQQWTVGLVTVLALAGLALVVMLTPLSGQIFPARGVGREPSGWQLPLGIVGFVGGAAAALRVRALTLNSNIGNRLPPLDPRSVLRLGQRRAIDGWVRAGVTPAADRATVTFDRVERFCTFPLPVWQILPMPAFFAALTFTYRGAVGWLTALWVGWAAAVLIMWWWGGRFREAADRYATTRAMVAGPATEPVTDPAPER